MEMKKITSEFFDCSIRVEKLVHLGTMCMGDAWADIAQEVFEDDADIWPALGMAEPELESDDPEAWGEAILDARKLGFLVQFATPIPDRFYEDGFTFSWGRYSTHWIYDESFKTACEKALKWQKEFIEQRRMKALEEKKQSSTTAEA